MRLGSAPMRLLAGLAAAVVIAACGNSPTAPLIDGTGEFSGRWDGGLWLGRGYAVMYGDTLVLVGHRPDPHAFYDEFVQVELVFTGDGTYSVPASGTARLKKIIGGDAGYLPEASGTLTISTSAGTVSGAVELDANGPDGNTWRFREGQFSLPLYASFADAPNLMRHRYP